MGCSCQTFREEPPARVMRSRSGAPQRSGFPRPRPTSLSTGTHWGGVLVCETSPPKSFRRSNGGDWTERLTRNRLEHSPLRWHYFTLALFLQTQREVKMKISLIAIASVGFLTSTAWVVAANAQANIHPNVYPGNTGERYGARAPGYAPAPAYGPSRRYARRAYRRSARAPQPSGGNLVYTPGSGPPPYDVPRQVYAAQSSGPWEWQAGPGPMRRGNKCVEHVDLNRGYGFMKDCPAPKR
jgi:hypothetical protein